MRREEDGDLDESAGGRLRLLVFTVLAGLFPVWILLTSTLAQLYPETVLVEQEGKLVAVLQVDWWGAGWAAATWMALGLAVAVPVAVVWGASAQRGRRIAMSGGASDEGGLPADTVWEVTLETVGKGEVKES